MTRLADASVQAPARIEGNQRRPLFLGDEQVYVRIVDDENLGVFSTAVIVDPGAHCVIGEVIRTGVFNSEDGWTDPLCFDAQAGHTYRIRYRSQRYQMIDVEDGSVVAEGNWRSQFD